MQLSSSTGEPAITLIKAEHKHKENEVTEPLNSII